MLQQLIDLISVTSLPIAVHGLIFAINLLVFFFAGGFLGLFNRGKDVSVQARILRFGAVVFLILHLVDIVFAGILEGYENYFIHFGYSLAVVFGGLIAFNVISYYSRQKFGKQREIDGHDIYLDTYNSRLVDLITAVFVILVTIYCWITIWDLDSLLQTTGFIGIIFGFLVLTNGVWFPDIYYGLVILNSNMLEDGDVIKLTDLEDEQIISRVSFVYTILLDIRNNHRVLIKNSQLINSRIDNLSKRASTDGLRHGMKFNIGFPTATEKDNPDAQANGGSGGYELYRRRIQAMFDQAFTSLAENTDAKINKNLPFEVALSHTGDYALTYTLNYYLEALPNTKVTKSIRQYLIRTPSLIQEAVNHAAVLNGVVLATPMLIDHKQVLLGSKNSTQKVVGQ